MTNSRRRFLAFIGLLGAPAAVWSPARAQMQAASQEAASVVSITCQSTSGDLGNADATYRAEFMLDGGKLTPSHIDPTRHYVEQNALKATYGKGAKFEARPDEPKGFNIHMPNFRIDVPDRPSEYVASFSALLRVDPSPADMNARLTLADGSHEDAYVKFYNDSLNDNLTQIDTQWATQSPLMMTKPVKVELIGDGKTLGTFSFDMSKVKWKPFITAEDKRITGATGVTYDAAVGSTTVEGCSGPTASGTVAPCFFTTAAAGTLGLSDDCWELQTLRRFRDGPLARTPEGRALAARYYAEAPRLVDGVNQRVDAARVWLAAYWTHILPCAVMARLGLNDAAVAHYKRLFARLERLAA